MLHGNSLGYFKRAHASIKGAVDAMHRLFEKSKIHARPFPAKMGLIVLPFSSTKQLFQNTILYYELGEFVYDEGNVDGLIGNKFDSLRKQSHSDGVIASKLTDAEQLRVFSWCKELFCDLFAVHIIGPAFTFASAD